MQERRLAAIMLVLRSENGGGPALRSFSGGGFIDIVGYTTLNGMDKDQTFQLLRKNCKIQKTIFEKDRGEWLKRCFDNEKACYVSSLFARRKVIIFWMNSDLRN